MEVIIKNNYKELSEAAAEYLMDAVKQKDNAVIGLPTGSTPIGMYKTVIEKYKNNISFQNVKTFNLDEYVGLDESNVNSYHYFMYDNFLLHIDIKKENIFIPDGNAADMNEECLKYENLIRTKGPVDIQVLGIGNNGHIGFNEPGDYIEPDTHIVNLSEDTININKRFFNSIDDVPKTAITMGIKTILSAKKIILIASGESKAEAIFKTVKGKITPQVPASLLRLHGDAVLIIDKDAARYL